jgi:hypothetical protein
LPGGAHFGGKKLSQHRAEKREIVGAEKSVGRGEKNLDFVCDLFKINKGVKFYRKLKEALSLFNLRLEKVPELNVHLRTSFFETSQIN